MKDEIRKWTDIFMLSITTVKLKYMYNSEKKIVAFSYNTGGKVKVKVLCINTYV